MKALKKIATVLLSLLVLLVLTFFIGRYGWKMGGFNVCETAAIEQINVEEASVRIRGYYPGSFPQGFLGYHAMQDGNTLYVGFKFSGLFGIFETGDFDITIPTRGTVTQVVVKSGDFEYTAWPQKDDFNPSNAVATENGIYIILERNDVYSVGWYFENESGGVANGDGEALGVGEKIYLDNDIFSTATNLERPVPVMLTFSGKDGKTIAYANIIYDPAMPVLTVTLVSNGEILVNEANVVPSKEEAK